MGNKYDPTNVSLKTCSYTWFENEESTDTKTESDLSPMSPLEDDEEVKLEAKELLLKE